MKTISKKDQHNITPDQAIDLLHKGNQRFIQNLRFNRNLLQQVNETAEGQYPFAAVLSCIDSRTPAELIFDQGLGDIFSIRIAGNIVNDDIIGSYCQIWCMPIRRPLCLTAHRLVLHLQTSHY